MKREALSHDQASGHNGLIRNGEATAERYGLWHTDWELILHNVCVTDQVSMRRRQAWLSALSHLGEDRLGQHMQLVKEQALRHARPLHAHDQVIDARGPVQRQHLLGYLIRRP
jgi:hypothetical protein